MDVISIVTWLVVITSLIMSYTLIAWIMGRSIAPLTHFYEQRKSLVRREIKNAEQLCDSIAHDLQTLNKMANIVEFRRDYNLALTHLKQAEASLQVSNQKLELRKSIKVAQFNLKEPSSHLKIGRSLFDIIISLYSVKYVSSNLENQIKPILVKAQEELWEIQDKPVLLQEKCQNLIDRAKRLRSAINVEANHGIETDDWDRRLARHIGDLYDLLPKLNLSSNTDADSFDVTINNFKELDRLITTLKDEVVNSMRFRSEFDEKIQRMEEEIRLKVDFTTKTHRDQKYSDLLSQANKFLENSRTSRRTRKFEDAKKILNLAIRLNRITGLLLKTHAEIDELRLVQDSSIDASQIDQVIEDFTKTLAMIPNNLSKEEANSITRVLKSIQEKSQKLIERHKAAIAEYDKNASLMFNQIKEQVLKLSAIAIFTKDTIIIEANSIMSTLSSASGNPRALFAWIEEAKGSKANLEGLYKKVEESLSISTDMITRTETSLAEADKMASEWQFLKKTRNNIKREIAKMKQEFDSISFCETYQELQERIKQIQSIRNEVLPIFNEIKGQFLACKRLVDQINNTKAPLQKIDWGAKQEAMNSLLSETEQELLQAKQHDSIFKDAKDRLERSSRNISYLSIRWMTSSQMEVIMTKHEVKGDQINLSGNVQDSIINIKSKLSHTLQQVNSIPNADQDDRAKLKQLLEQLIDRLEQTPSEHASDAEAVAETAKELVERASRKKPNKTLVQISAEGLKKAAENIQTVLPSVLPIAMEIVAFIKKLFP